VRAGTRVSERGASTRAAHAGLPAPAQGEPFLPGPVLGAPFHLAGDVGDVVGYNRDGNPTWARYESALAELEGADVVVFASGMAAVHAALETTLKPGDVLVAPNDGYPGIRVIAEEHLAPRGIEVRLVPTQDAAIREALPGATAVFLESPSNPGLDVVDIAAIARDTDAIVAVDNTLAGPLHQPVLELGAQLSVASATKYLTGHSDINMGYVATADTAALREWRSLTGALPGPFETWLAHRSLATYPLRLERQIANAQALASALRERDEVSDVRYPGLGAVVCFTLASAAAAERFLAACELVIEATSFGGLHSSAERRARWGTDAIAEGFIRFSCGIEDTPDLLADVARGLDVLSAA
jgi:cystathionine gamma-lyase